MTETDEVRRDVAAMHGLPEAAAGLLLGETVDELERSAAKLAELLAARAPTEQTPEQANLLADALAPGVKQARQRALVELLHPTPRQQARPRDEHGRFTTRSGGFDGGARQPVPIRRPPEEEHGETIVQLARLSRLGGSARW
jgi:hypothetical protein